MTITTIRSTRRLGLASSAAAAALLLLASACGTETAATQAPASIGGLKGSSTETQSPADRDECLVQQAKQQNSASSCTAADRVARGHSAALPGALGPSRAAARPAWLTAYTHGRGAPILIGTAGARS